MFTYEYEPKYFSTALRIFKDGRLVLMIVDYPPVNIESSFFFKETLTLQELQEVNKALAFFNMKRIS